MIKGDALDLHRDIFFLHSRFEILESSHQLPSASWAHMMADKPKQKWTTVNFLWFSFLKCSSSSSANKCCFLRFSNWNCYCPVPGVWPMGHPCKHHISGHMLLLEDFYLKLLLPCPLCVHLDILANIAESTCAAMISLQRRQDDNTSL